MTQESKNILVRSINDFRASTDTNKEHMVEFVDESVKSHEKAVKSIGIGYAEHLYVAGKVFLRIYKN